MHYRMVIIKEKVLEYFLDTYNGGGQDDIVGATNEPGSGRINNLIKNQYSADKPYRHPDTTNNNQ